MHLHANPLSQLAIHERTEPFSHRVCKWAKGVPVGTVVPINGMDDCVWIVEKTEDTCVTIKRTLWHWVSIQEACDSFPQILALPDHFVTTISLE